MELKFYSTGYNYNNRMYSRQSFTDNNPTPVFTLTLSENYTYPEPFYLDNEQGLSLIQNKCDYITFFLLIEHYAFITAIRPNPLNDGYTVYIQEDIWSTYGLNSTGLNCNIQGSLLRAHVNDFENSKPTLKYTVDEAEEEILYDGMIFTKDKAFKYPKSARQEQLKILYVLCAVNKNIPQDKQIINYYNTPTQNIVNVQISNQYKVYFALVSTATNQILNVQDTDGTILEASGYVDDLNVIAGQDTDVASYGIVNMYYSDICPYGVEIDYATSKLVIKQDFYKPFQFKKNTLNYSDKATLIDVNVLSLSNTLNIVTPTNEFIYTKDMSITQTEVNNATYTTYLSKYIVKPNTHIYNPRCVVYTDSVIKLDYFYEKKSTESYITVDIFIDALLQYIGIYQVNSHIKVGYSAFTICQIYSQLEPVQHNSYWTRLSARQSTIEANRAKVTGSLSYYGGLISGGVGLASDIVKTVGSQPEQLAGNILSTVQSGVDYTINSIVGGINLATLYERANITIQKNNSIINGGIVQAVSYGGSQRFMLNDYIFFIHGDLTPYNKEKICYQLHKYGYLTNIPLNNEYFTKHERQKFNFVLAENTMCSGLVLEYCRDIEDMFNKGVTLWKSKPLDYKVVNFPINALKAV